MRVWAIALALGLASCSAATTTAPLSSPQSIVPHAETQQSVSQIDSSAPKLQAFTAGTTPGFLSTAIAWDIAPGAGDSMWFTDSQTPAIGTITSDGTVHEYTGLPLYSRPYSIVSSGDGNAWFTDPGTASVGRITASGKINEFTDARLTGMYPSCITIAPDGTIWFIALAPKSLLAQVSPSGNITRYGIAQDLNPDGSLIADNAGNLWFLANNAAGRTVMVERHPDGSFTRYPTKLQPAFVPCCPNFAAKRLALGPDGNVWFTTLHYLVGYSPANWIGTINATGSQSYFRVLYGAIHYPAYPSGITTADGNLWFTGDDPFQLNGGLWRLDTSGAMHAYPIAYNPVTIATGRHHHLWFTSHFGGQPSQIVEVTLP